MYSPWQPTRRLRGKTPQRRQQTSLLAPLDLEADLGREGDAETKRRAYLVTLPHPRQELARTVERLVAPGSLTKEAVWNCFLDACAHPTYAYQHFADGRVVLEMGEVFREFHEENEEGICYVHDHLAVLGRDRFRFQPVKRALLQRHGLASHWSVSHDGHWSCVRYCYMPTPKKPLTSPDRNPYLWPANHLPLEDLCYEPQTAEAMRVKRLKAVREAT